MTKPAPQCQPYDWQEAPLLDSQTLAVDLARHFHYTLGRDKVGESQHYLYQALALTIRDRLVARMRHTRNDNADKRSVSYLSLEFLIGRSLNNAILNLDLADEVTAALANYCAELEHVADAEHDAGLGNGGLGRLAACFLDSCAAMGLPVTGYGIRYEYGMFNQRLDNGYQVEQPDHWLHEGHPWELPAPDQTVRVKFFGHVEVYKDASGRSHRVWVDTHDVFAVPYDVPVPGSGNDVVNTLRLWKSEATDEFDLSEFNAGGYAEAVAKKNLAEQISMVLYPNDASENGKELRLRQQYFLCSASLQDRLKIWCEKHGDDFTEFADYHVFQLNDTHPSIAVAELMRLLIDEHALDWQGAWEITTNTMAYTNHTLLPEALEKWSVALFARLLPRLLEIIYEINARFLVEVAKQWPGCSDKQRAMSLIEEGAEPQVRMAYLAIVGSYSVNGVAALHSQLLRQNLFKDFYELWPHKFNNKTNGVTPRRWLMHCNPRLAALITSKIGSHWQDDFSDISKLRRYYDEPQLLAQWQQVKQANKQRLCALVQSQCGVEFDANMLFDVQVKRIHEYKRQLLNILHVIHLYRRICDGDTETMVPRCVLIGGKAAPGYFMAKQIIKLISNVAATVNNDAKARPWLRVAFLPNYNVTAMETICPAADLSEQISTAGKEASGTGNMKFMMNGAITIGTLDGANVEMREALGGEHFFVFGAEIDQVDAIRSHYNARDIIAGDENLNAVLALLKSGQFNLCEPGIFDSILAALYSDSDPWLTCYDFADYCQAQERVSKAYEDKQRWTQMSVLNTAASGPFSSDRTIAQYSQEIWRLSPIASPQGE
ncbi:glycogen/starch/alpha-glucan phosphorylase [Pseudoalteromonas sp. BDTF-M6]|uniref:glycogen/starch/alpha-glucan phosphorylase n=1 Tax=Pseudoalteromonas sp. BDTF-M6 TaxID=2796132 RepID=UPI001BB00449|nr:glycogen/starch/alpha-glucan phosphorylase [Pseudoalteromonas sp. BDTF-M6]MBS3796859.1 glycogen/starch/alpha-glucan phosphorylase [Pseudoalteromonas sp. BDTF-M6]